MREHRQIIIDRIQCSTSDSLVHEGEDHRSERVQQECTYDDEWEQGHCQHTRSINHLGLYDKTGSITTLEVKGMSSRKERFSE